MSSRAQMLWQQHLMKWRVFSDNRLNAAPLSSAFLTVIHNLWLPMCWNVVLRLYPRWSWDKRYACRIFWMWRNFKCLQRIRWKYLKVKCETGNSAKIWIIINWLFLMISNAELIEILIKRVVFIIVFFFENLISISKNFFCWLQNIIAHHGVVIKSFEASN